MARAPTVLFPKFAPDQNEPGQNFSSVIQNVVPRVDGYGPVPALIVFTSALPAPCRGYYYARNADSSISIFAGTATDLYEMNNTDFTWIRVSKGGVSYSPVSSNSNWQFLQFEATMLAVQANTVPQSFLLGVSAAFADLGGSPPQAGCIAAINGFIVLSVLLGNVNRVQWSDLFGITTWTAGVGYSDFQDLPDGGGVHGLSGGENYGLAAIFGFAQDFNVFFGFKQGTQTLANYCVIVDQQNTNFFHRLVNAFGLNMAEKLRKNIGYITQNVGILTKLHRR